MAFTLSRNLRLRLDSNLTANSRYNLERIDSLGAAVVVDSTDNVNIRSRGDITIEPESPDIGGSGVGGTVTVGTSSHSLSSFVVYADSFSLGSPISLLDVASGGDKYLLLQYKSDVTGSVDTTANRTLSIDMEGASRNLVLGGNLQFLGGNLTLTLSSNTALTLPTSGTLATLAGTETLTNKSIDATTNTLSSIGNASISASAGIAYSKLALTGSIVNSDIGVSAAISGTKISPIFGAQQISTESSVRFVETFNTDIRAAQAGQVADIVFDLPSSAGTSGQVLTTNGSGVLSWSDVGIGTVTSVALAMPAEFSVAGSPITSSGTLTVTRATQTANTILAGPTTGAPAIPTFRSLVVADLPTAIPADNIGGGAVSNTEFSYLDGVTSAIQGQIDGKQPIDADLTALAGLATTGILVRTGSGTAVTRTIGSGTNITVTNGDGVAGAPSVAFSGTLPIANGGTNSAIALSNNRVIQSSAGAIIEAAAITASRALISDSNGIPTHSATTSTELGYVSGVTSAIQTQLNAKANSGFSASDWITGDGTTKIVTHSLASLDVLVQVYDKTDGQTIYVDTVIRTDTNTVTLTSSEAPGAAGWRVLIQRLA